MGIQGKRLVFVGGGHAHLFGLKHADRLVRAGARVTLVAPDRHHYYSGMGPGLLSRTYRVEQCRVDVESLAVSRGCTFVRDRVGSVDAEGRTVLLEGNGALGYDAVSFNTGSRVPAERIPGALEEAIPVKPVENVERLRNAVLRHRNGRACRVLVLGGGPAGVELAGNLCRLARAEALAVRVILAEAGDRLLPQLPARAGAIARRSLERRGVQVETGFRTGSMAGGMACSEQGVEIPYDEAALTIGIVPHPLYVESGLRTGPQGGLLVNEFLQSVEHPEIFGGGDCIELEHRRLARIGVYAVRQGPVLSRNLQSFLGEAPLSPFRPQRRFLLILNLGDGTGLVTWDRWVARGRWGFRWKNRLDTSFMAKYQVSGEDPDKRRRA